MYNKDVRKKEGHISLEFSIRSGDVFYIICNVAHSVNLLRLYVYIYTINHEFLM